MATEQQKTAAVKHLQDRIRIADANGLHTTAQSWRDYLMNFAMRTAEDIVIAREFGTFSDKE